MGNDDWESVVLTKGGDGEPICLNPVQSAETIIGGNAPLNGIMIEVPIDDGGSSARVAIPMPDHVLQGLLSELLALAKVRGWVIPDPAAVQVRHSRPLS